MADDIVTRLRDIAALVTRLRGACFNNSFDGTVVVATCSEGRWGLRCPPCATADLIEDQQDEIERLRAENNYLANSLERIGSSINDTLKAHDAWQEARRG